MTIKKIRAKKIFLTTSNQRLPDNTQISIVVVLNDDLDISINEYSKVFTKSDLGNYSIVKEGNSGVLSFFPFDNRPNDYTYASLTFDYFQAEPTGEYSNELLGDLISVGSYSTERTSNFSKILEIPFYFSSSKIEILSSTNDINNFNSISLTHNGNNPGIGSTIASVLNYGAIFSENLKQTSSTGLGTYYSYIENNKIYVDFIPSVEISDKVNFTASLVSIANTNFSLVSMANTSFPTDGSKNLQNVSLLSKKTYIPKNTISDEVVPTLVGGHQFDYRVSYYIAQCTDLTNNHTQLSEIIVVNDRAESYLSEYGSIFTKDRIGNFSSLKTLDTELIFTPIQNVDIEVTIFQIKISSFLEFVGLNVLDLGNLTIESGLNRLGSSGDSTLNFELNHNNIPIFERTFNGSSSSIVNLIDDTILLPNHFFVTGEHVRYISDEINESSSINSIGIGTTVVSGIGITDKLPNDLYIIKVDGTKIKLAQTAEDALKILPKSLNLIGFGSNTTHKIVSTQQNSKVLISVDNIIQSPVQFTDITTNLSRNINFNDLLIQVDNEKLFKYNDIIKIDKEFMTVSSIGIGETNFMLVLRGRLGTNVDQHSIGSIVRKYEGNYNIVNNKICFKSAPYGLNPTPSPQDAFDEQDYLGLQIKSSFDGRVFLRSGIPLSTNKTYTGNYIFDDLSNQFNGIQTSFTLTEQNNYITGISTNNSVVLINNVYQSPKGLEFSNVSGFYELKEESNQTKIEFIGNSIENGSDINTISIPYGGVIVSVGSTDGFGYQPLVSAGGTAIVSIAGTISQISIGNSGSGYRVGIQTQVNVGIKTYSSGIPNINIVGIASITKGNVVSVKITNPGSGYTFTNPPEVVFDSPIGYTNIPLIYSNDSQPGVGTQSTIDIVVGNGNNIIDFNIVNYGYGYKSGDILTVPIVDYVGIPTTLNENSFSEFKIIVDETYEAKFSGWSMGEFQVLDNLDSKFNGVNKNFQISLEGRPISISKKKGSPIELEYVLLVFINDILQIPFKNYKFTGSVIKFDEAPKGRILNPPYNGDTSKIIFYKGTEDIDVIFNRILDSPKIGDLLTIQSDSKQLSQKFRIIETISSIDTVDTNKYSDIGISDDQNLLRPVRWCRQTEDLYIFGKEVTKDRRIYDPYINPVSYLIKNIEINDSEIFVDSAKLFFDYPKENIPEKEYNIIEIISNSDDFGGYEKITNVSEFEGDFGVIVGIGSTSIVGVADTCLVFDLFIPIDSHLRNQELNSDISNQGISGIQTGYRFVVSGTSKGSPNISFDLNGNSIGVGTTFLDNVYECLHFYTDDVEIVGIGFTTVTKVISSVNTYEGIVQFDTFFGKYSWGKITTPYRSSPKSFDTNLLSSSGIGTNPIIRRKNSLKKDLYLP